MFEKHKGVNSKYKLVCGILNTAALAVSSITGHPETCPSYSSEHGYPNKLKTYLIWQPFNFVFLNLDHFGGRLILLNPMKLHTCSYTKSILAAI